ncbi:MAG: hypothetical protein D6710_01845 [Nitrospirae bacterium]|nr:MAG: hypothetical protein D6710_01845 [Nitrospirota bacterium]
MVKVVEGGTLDNFGQGGEVVIDLKSAENLAKKFDYNGRDLIFHIDFDFGIERPTNFVVIDPVLFGTSAFVEILDVATLNADGEFETVDGFQEGGFDKILTPEANKAISDENVAKTLAPSQFAYGGLGVFAFPLRITQKVRVTMAMKDPVPNPYERLYILMQETVTDTTVVTTTKKSGIF